MRKRKRLKRGPLSSAESARLNRYRQYWKDMDAWMYRAFTEEHMTENAALVVWTKGQMRGIRATLKRLGLGR